MTLLLVTTFPLPLSLGKCLARKFYNFLVENVGPRGHRGHASPAMQAIMIAVAHRRPTEYVHTASEDHDEPRRWNILAQ